MNSQIEAANDAADAIHRKMYPEQYVNEPVDPNAPVPPVEPAAPVIDPNAPKPLEPVDPNAPVVPVEPAALATPDPNKAAPVVDPDSGTDNWEQKYKVLQGKYDAEVPRTVSEKKELQSLLNSAIATINQINANRVPVNQDPNTPAVTDVPLIKLDDLTGPELKAMKEDYPDIYQGFEFALNGVVNKLNEQTSKIVQEVKNLKTEQNITHGSTFKSELSRLVPDWETVKDDPDFVVWLSQTEKFSGQLLYELAHTAASAKDANRLAGFYNGYKESIKVDPVPAVDPAPVIPVTPTPPAAVLPAQAMKNISPPRSANQPTPPAEPINTQAPKITQSFIRKFYQDAVKGVFQGRDAEYATVEAQIHEATRTGKVLPG